MPWTTFSKTAIPFNHTEAVKPCQHTCSPAPSASWRSSGVSSSPRARSATTWKARNRPGRRTKNVYNTLGTAGKMARYMITWDENGKKMPDAQDESNNTYDNEYDLQGDEAKCNCVLYTEVFQRGGNYVGVRVNGVTYELENASKWTISLQTRLRIYEYHQKFLLAVAAVQHALHTQNGSLLRVDRYEHSPNSIYKVYVRGATELDVIVVSIDGDNCILERLENTHGVAVGGSFHRAISVENFCQYLRNNYLSSRPVVDQL